MVNKNSIKMKKYRRQWYLKHSDKMKEIAKKKYIKNPIPQMVSNAKIRAKQKNLFFDIDSDYLRSIYPKDNMCPVLNVPFQLGYVDENKKNKDYAPSLDRIIPEKGYVKGNLVFVCNIVNRVKSDSTIETLEKVLNFYKKYHELNCI
jgi:hypothetical protein